MKKTQSLMLLYPKKRKTVEEIKQENIEETYFDRDELEEFLTATIKYGLKYDKERFFAMAFIGLRPGELCALQKKDLLFENDEIDINKTIYSETNSITGYELTPPKTYGSIRVIPVERFIMDMLKKVVHDNDKHKMKYRKLIPDYHDKDFVFAHENGYPFLTITMRNRMRRILKKTNIKKECLSAYVPAYTY
ncbi:tyrosine-type recombinase/integrase [Virgibacillus halophilus]|uniref:Tyrosine-type recombinase/integrase n=1 Tax=Tigheibacillus halophilus TaxID=361280 RepID=A0ABU5C7U9_9BACI|nr:tyrosine-type recombinase/integrase [Virgibacillus halophilus]